MNRLKFPLFALQLVLLALPAFCQLERADPETRKICAEAKDIQLPATDRPSPEEARALEGCVSEDFYYGFGMPVDPVKARKCAYLEMDAGKSRGIAAARQCGCCCMPTARASPGISMWL